MQNLISEISFAFIPRLGVVDTRRLSLCLRDLNYWGRHVGRESAS